MSIEAQQPQHLERKWGEEILVAETPDYTLKRLNYKAGTAGGLQMHTLKDEAFYLRSGQAWVDYDDGTGELRRELMTAGHCFHIPAGAAHRFTAIEDCEVYEASTTIKDDRVHLESYYGEPEDIGGLPSTAPEPVR